MRSECCDVMDLKDGSCVCSASSERSARRRLPEEMRASRTEMWSGRCSDSRSETCVRILQIWKTCVRQGSFREVGQNNGSPRPRKVHRREGEGSGFGSAQ